MCLQTSLSAMHVLLASSLLLRKIIVKYVHKASSILSKAVSAELVLR